VDDKDIRQTYYNDQCTLGSEIGPQTIIVRQVVAEQEARTVLDIHVVVPAKKPAIEQIVDVLVKDVQVNYVDIIRDKVIVRGEFEIKAIYVAYLPDRPVHAMEIKHYRWTQDIDMPGARRGMDADASVIVEFVDYDVDEWTRAYKYKNYEHFNHDDDNDDDDNCPEWNADDDCQVDSSTDDECQDDSSADDDNVDDSNADDNYHEDHHNDGDDGHHHHHHHHHHSCRNFDVSVVLKVVAKVMADREVQIGYAATMPTKPAG
jgi:hypothetical protein